MKDLKQNPTFKPSISEGWAVHIYDGDRHLRFTLEPSHGWAFGTGLGLGLLAAVIGANLVLPANSRAEASPPAAASLPTSASRNSVKESMFWID